MAQAPASSPAGQATSQDRAAPSPPEVASVRAERIPSGASILDRAVALSGRDPRWPG